MALLVLPMTDAGQGAGEFGSKALACSSLQCLQLCLRSTSSEFLRASHDVLNGFRGRTVRDCRDTRFGFGGRGCEALTGVLEIPVGRFERCRISPSCQCCGACCGGYARACRTTLWPLPG